MPFTLGSLSDTTFKSALGIDKRLVEGLWLELRVGRRHRVGGSGDETAALFNLKFSPSSTLPKALSAQ